MITAILIIVAIVVLIKFFGPLLVELFEFLFDIIMLPLAVFGGFFGFLLEALLFIGGLWLIATLLGF